MTATRCHFDVTSDRCADCAMLGDCLDETLPPPRFDARTDVPLRPIVPKTRHKKRRDRWAREGSPA